MDELVINVLMAYPHLRRLEGQLINELVRFLASILAIPSCGGQMGAWGNDVARL